MAQLVARLNGIQKVRGSNPLSSAKVRLALKSQTKGHHKTVSFLFAPYYFAAQQATAEGRRNNVSLHFVSLPLVALGTNPCLRQRKARQQPCLFHASAEGQRNNVTGLLHNLYSVATELSFIKFPL